jgi:hypothetical protein
MLGGGVDGHVLRALIPAISSHITAFKQSTLPAAYVQLPPAVTSKTVPPELAHRRFACPGRKAEMQLGWQRDETSVCANCCAGKLQRADIRRDPVSKIQSVIVKATSRAEPRLEFSRLSARLGSNSAHLRAARLGSKFEKNRRLGSARIFEIQNGSARLGSAHIFAVCILDSNPVFVHGHTNAYIHIIYTHTTHLTRISTHTYIRINACSGLY